MANGKTFADMKKPVRQPTPEQIAAFEETGRVERRLDPALQTAETQKSLCPERPSGDAEGRADRDPDLRKPAKPQTQKAASTENSEQADTEMLISVKAETSGYGNTSMLETAKAETSKSANTETRSSGSIVRLTIDLAEADHIRFKTACVMTRRKMVDEVRAFIERRTAELEHEAGRAL